MKCRKRAIQCRKGQESAETGNNVQKLAFKSREGQASAEKGNKVQKMAIKFSPTLFTIQTKYLLCILLFGK